MAEAVVPAIWMLEPAAPAAQLVLVFPPLPKEEVVTARPAVVPLAPVDLLEEVEVDGQAVAVQAVDDALGLELNTATAGAAYRGAGAGSSSVVVAVVLAAAGVCI